MPNALLVMFFRYNFKLISKFAGCVPIFAGCCGCTDIIRFLYEHPHINVSVVPLSKVIKGMPWAPISDYATFYDALQLLTTGGHHRVVVFSSCSDIHTVISQSDVVTILTDKFKKLMPDVLRVPINHALAMKPVAAVLDIATVERAVRNVYLHCFYY
jgi:hypothetical protein